MKQFIRNILVTTYLLVPSLYLSGCGLMKSISRRTLGDEHYLEQVFRSRPFNFVLIAAAIAAYCFLLQTQGKQHGSSDSKKQMAYLLIGFVLLSLLYKFSLWMYYFARPEPY